jgi:hypothetical protein
MIIAMSTIGKRPALPLDEPDGREPVQRLFANLKAALPGLRELLERCSDHWGYEDPVYRFYHQSFKVYGLQETTTGHGSRAEEPADSKKPASRRRCSATGPTASR